MSELKLSISSFFSSMNLRLGFFLKHTTAGKFVALCFLITSFIFLSESNAFAFNPEKYEKVCSKVLKILDSEFGGLLSACAGVGAIVASATGGFRAAWALVVVAVGSFTLKEYQEIWFPSCSS